MSEWRPYELSRENEFRARMEREPFLKTIVGYLVGTSPLVGMMFAAAAFESRHRGTMEYLTAGHAK